MMQTSNMIRRSMIIGQRRMSFNLESEMWKSLDDIGAREKVPSYFICNMIYDRKPLTASFASAMRVFISAYMKHSGDAKSAIDS